jgi:sugar phosphate isomerase/epimerase
LEALLKFLVSTTAFRGRPLDWIIDVVRENGWWLEFSSGLPYRDGMEEIFLNANCVRFAHNYFPAPKDPFVLNLASLNPAISKRSREHCEYVLRLTSKVGSPFYSLHAGFCLDPDPKELGHQLKLVMDHPREDHFSSFIGELEHLSAIAGKLGVKIVIENNVIAKRNLLLDGRNPLLGASAAELLRILESVEGKNLGLLIDTGHLKVSAKTLGLNLTDEIEKLRGHVIAFHHSDNDGIEDTNFPISDDYWFLPFMKYFPDSHHVLEVHDQSIEQIQRQAKLLGDALGLKG